MEKTDTKIEERIGFVLLDEPVFEAFNEWLDGLASVGLRCMSSPFKKDPNDEMHIHYTNKARVLGCDLIKRELLQLREIALKQHPLPSDQT